MSHEASELDRFFGMDLMETGWVGGCELDSSDSRQEQVVGCFHNMGNFLAT
jgi:hypothetical protein